MLRATLRKVIIEGGGGHSTIDAIRRVMDTVTNERERRHAVRKDVLLVTLDEKTRSTLSGGMT